MKKAISILFVMILLLSAVFCTPAQAEYDEFLEQGFHSQCYLMICTDNDEVIFSKDENKQVKCASLTKIVTASIILTSVPDLQQTVTVPQSCIDELKGTGSSTGGLKPGETYTIYDLLCCLLVASANDAATVLANYLTGDNRQEFVDKMNNYVQSLGCVNTHFENVHGLDSENHYSSAADMAVLLENAMKLNKFAEITSKRSYELPETSQQDKRTITNTNKTLSSAIKDYYCRYIDGGKTGYTSGAGQCLAVSASNNGYNYIAVAMGGTMEDIDDDHVDENGAFVDCKNMIDWAVNNLRLISIADAAKIVGEVKVRYGKSDYVSLSPSSTAFSLMPKSIDAGGLYVTIIDKTKPDHVNAPIEEGDIICKGEVHYAGEVIKTIDLVAAAPVKRSFLSAIGNLIVRMFRSTAFQIILILAAAVLIVLIVMRKNGTGGGKKNDLKPLNYKDFFKDK
ncbi:MAG: D-alanyl-D-alanine carboxypeptidase [Clostridia bacterium]|nr:D-alanyl-D-alanine carboxypeptidase [Clostridia bacterium]